MSPRSYTPKHLADKILQSKSALEGERKQVTVLFADVKGSMELAEQLDHEARRKIAGELLLLDEKFQALLPILFDFMAVADPAKPAPAMSPEGRQQQLFAFVRHLTQARSEHEPTVFFLDDLHWIDPGSEAFLAHSVDAAEQTRTLWLVNFRPEYHADWMNKSYYLQLPLRPLGPEAIAELLSDLLGTHPSVAALPRRIHERTGGNPFFIEEVVQSLVESGSLAGTKGAYRLVAAVDALDIPPKVQNVLAARLDRLAPREKRLLQTAAVIGREFAEPILKCVVGVNGRERAAAADLAAALAALRRAEFIYEQALYPEVEYAFKHPLTQEVAYRSQLAVRRAELHAAVARAIEQVDSDKLDERAALLAYHWEEAGEALMAARWHARTARQAGLDSPAEALRHWQKVWEILQPAPQSAESVALRIDAAPELLKLGFRQGMSTEQINEIFREGKALAVASDNARAHVKLLYGLGVNHMLDRPRRAVPIFEEAILVADRTTDNALRYAAREPLVYVLACLGDLDAALRVSDENLDRIRGNPTLAIELLGFSTAWWYGVRGWTLTDLGRFDEAAESFQRCEEGARRRDEGEILSWTHGFRARMFERAGDVPSALAAGRRAVEGAEKVGSLLALVIAYTHHGMALGLNREWEAARARCDQALEIARANRVWLSEESDILAALADAHLGLGDARLASRTAEEAVRIARCNDTPISGLHAHLARARVLLALDGAAAEKDVEAELHHALTLVRSTGARSYEPQIYVERAWLADVLSNPAARQQWLRKAHRLFTEMGARGHAERLAKEIGC